MNNPQKENFFCLLTRFCIRNRILVYWATALIAIWGLAVAPFAWRIPGLPRDPVPVDAIPDIGENQQIVFTEWAGRSPRDVEDQITYPLSAALLGLPGIKTVRGYSMFGFSLVYVIFNDDVEFYWARTRVLESLGGRAARDLPEGVKPSIGPDATSLGQVFWYTLQGVDSEGRPVGGWDLHELRSLQDWYVRYALLAVPGVSEVASVGGFVQEYQVDVDPSRMRYHNVRLEEVVDGVRRANVDVGARTIEVNKVEYVIRGLGFIKNIEHIRESPIKLVNDTPVLVRHVADVGLGPAARRGALDHAGNESVGGVVVVRYGENPLAVIEKVKEKIGEISVGLPKRTLADGTISQVRIVPFYDRTDLIHETLATLLSALADQMLITVLVVIVMMVYLRSSLVVAGVLPLAVLICFIAMKVFGVDANIVALAGIAIAIGTLVDMGIIVTENTFRRLDEAPPGADQLETIASASREVGGAVLTAVATTIVGFMPVFALEAAEGKLFKPLAFTKTFALTASVVVALVLIPPLIYSVFGRKEGRRRYSWVKREALIFLGSALMFVLDWRLGLMLGLVGGTNLAARWLPAKLQAYAPRSNSIVVGLGVTLLLARFWMPLGPDKGQVRNFVFVALIFVGVLGAFRLFQRRYGGILAWCLDHKAAFLALPSMCLLFAALVWLGYGRLTAWIPEWMHRSAAGRYLAGSFPGIGREFMPPLEEGSYLYMPVTMPHASIGEALDILQRQDRFLAAIPEVEKVVGKLGRAESPLDPAPISMVETVINYRPEYLEDNSGRRETFRFIPGDVDWFRTAAGDPVLAIDGEPYLVQGRYARDENGRMIPDPDGKPFRLWRPALDPRLNPGRTAWPGIRKPDDIWQEIVLAGTIPGTTVAPKLQPISARLVMLQSGIRASMGVKVYGTDLSSIHAVTQRIEKSLREVDAIDPQSVIADRIIGKPYLEIEIDRRAIAQYGINLQQVQDVIETAIGGKPITTTVQGRERYPVRVRYMRELRDHLDTIGKVLVAGPGGVQVPLLQLAQIRYAPGPEMIRSEGSFVTGYVLFDKKPGRAETNVVEEAGAHLNAKIRSGELAIPTGVGYAFTGSYENDLRAGRKLALIVPLALLIIFFILYLQFRSVAVSSLVFSGVAVAWAGGLIMIWLYEQPWFLNFEVFGSAMRDLFQVHPINLSVAVWVGFLALFGIAVDDGVVMATYLNHTFAVRTTRTVGDIRAATIEASLRRVRPCLMTTATTILALIPVLVSTGRGSDLMVPLAIPSFGGMILEVMTMLVVPVLYCLIQEFKLRRSAASASANDDRQQAASAF
jgi:Cu(I)/Ag(I) efflux system membrane protein CusA/SilA